MTEYLELIFDIFDETNQRASVVKGLTATQMVEAILQEFEELEPHSPRSYGLYFEYGDRQLEPGRSLSDQGVQPGDRLIFSWASDQHRQHRKSLRKGVQYGLQEISSQVIYPLEWQPALIGRPDADRAHNALLAVDLEWLPNSRRVSRRHAQITERRGVYYLESLAPKNPTFLNGQAVAHGLKYKLQIDDDITLGYSGIGLRFIHKV